MTKARSLAPTTALQAAAMASYTTKAATRRLLIQTRPVVQTRGASILGQIVGVYSDNTGGHGFLYSDGSYVTLNAPGALDTYAYGINDKGQIVGNYLNGSGTHGFLYSNGTYEPLNDPLGVDGTYAQGINNKGGMLACSMTVITLRMGFFMIMASISR